MASSGLLLELGHAHDRTYFAVEQRTSPRNSPSTFSPRESLHLAYQQHCQTWSSQMHHFRNVNFVRLKHIAASWPFHRLSCAVCLPASSAFVRHQKQSSLAASAKSPSSSHAWPLPAACTSSH